MGYSDALRGYAYRVHTRDGFKCVYCGWDGTIWPNWLFLSWDHLLPHGNALRDDEKYIVSACRFCNESCNRTSFPVEGKTPQEIIEMKRKAITEVRNAYFRFWKENVEGKMNVK
jgi:hypothetical protein